MPHKKSALETNGQVANIIIYELITKYYKYDFHFNSLICQVVNVKI